MIETAWVLWAQALDATSISHLEKDGEIIPAEPAERRQAILFDFESLSRNGKQRFSQGGIELTVNRQYLALEVPTDQKDHVGRIAPVICYVKRYGSIDDTFIENTLKKLQAFAKRINRTISAEAEATARKALNLQKKSLQRSRQLLVGLGGGVLIVAIYLMTKI